MIKKFLIILFILSVMINSSWAIPKTPEELEDLYINEYQYMTDQEQFGADNFEYFQSPKEFEKNKKGDCDDFAIHSHLILKALGYDVKMYAVYKKNWGHAITVFKRGKYYHIFSSGYLIYTQETDPIEAIKKTYPGWLVINRFIPIKYGKINKFFSLFSDWPICNRWFDKKGNNNE